MLIALSGTETNRGLNLNLGLGRFIRGLLTRSHVLPSPRCRRRRLLKVPIDKGLTLETSTFELFTVVNLRYELG